MSESQTLRICFVNRIDYWVFFSAFFPLPYYSRDSVNYSQSALGLIGSGRLPKLLPVSVIVPECSRPYTFMLISIEPAVHAFLHCIPRI